MPTTRGIAPLSKAAAKTRVAKIRARKAAKRKKAAKAASREDQ